MSSGFKLNYNLKEKWLDMKKTKNHPKNCQKEHTFCNIQYEWADQQSNNQKVKSPVNPSIPNIILPKSKQRAITVNYESMTQEGLDDWIAQSLNRNLISLLNPQKKFHIPQQLEEDVKHRYRNKSSHLKGQQDSYFGNKLQSNKKRYYGAQKNKLQISDLFFDYKKLQAKSIGGTPIRLRENKNKKPAVRRRNAILLDQDIYYNRLSKELSKSKQKLNKKQDRQLFLTQSQNMFYSFNIQTLKRKSCKQQTPSSITEKQYQRLKQPPKDFLSRNQQNKQKDQKIHQKFRQSLLESAKFVQKKIIQIPKHKSSFQITQPKKIIEVEKIKSNLNQNKKKQSTQGTNSFDIKSIGKDKVLQKKVINLLNDMRVVAQQIDFQMSELNIHVPQVMLRNGDFRDTRPQTKWVYKAQQKLNQKQMQLSIDCYKQALIIQPQYFIPIFNIAALLQKQKMYTQSRDWFQIALQFKIDQENVKFGLSIVFLKQTKFQNCFTLIQQLIKKNEQLKKQPKLAYHYIRALCCKKLRKFDLVKNDYQILLKSCHPQNFTCLSDFIFSMLIAKSRRLGLKFDCLSYMKFKQTLQIISFITQGKVKQQNQNLRSIAKKLVEANFFKRFSISLIQKLLQRSKYQYVKSDSLIFVNDDQTAIILTGMVIVRNHLINFQRPQIISVLKQGGVIGGGKLDNFINEKSNNWFVAKSDVQIVKIQRKSFNQFWKGQITFQFDFKYNFIKNVGLFKNLPEITLFNICEKIQKVEFKKGTILFNDCTYRNQVLNSRGRGFGLSKSGTSTDPRFVNVKKMSSQRKKGKCRFAQLLKKHSYGINQLKFKKLKYPGLFILIKGKVQIEDDRGFRCSDLISQRQYFGQNLFINSDGYQNYGRMVVDSENAQLYHLTIDKMSWIFTSDDKKIMKQNTLNRYSIQTIRFLRGRFRQCQNTRINYKFLLNQNY